MKTNKIFISVIFIFCLMVSLLTISGCNSSNASNEASTSNLQEVKSNWTPASMGGPILNEAANDYTVIRWLGNSCWEIVYRGQIILIDNFYDRGPRAPETGVKAIKVTKATAIIITHGHKDHMSDTAQVAKQTGAPVYGHKAVTDTLLTQGVLVSQLRTFTDPEINTISFDGFTVKMIHTLHNVGGKNASGFRSAIDTYTSPTAATLSEEAAISARGSSDSSIATQGLFSFLVTFDSGFTFFATESNAMGYAPGMQTWLNSLTKDVDIIAAPCQLGYDPSVDIYYKKVVDIIMATKAHLVLPQHHDVFPDFPQTSVLPLAQWVQEKMSATTKFYNQLYREPLCFNVKTQVGVAPLSPL